MAHGEERAERIKCENCGLQGLVTVTELDSKMVAISEAPAEEQRTSSQRSVPRELNKPAIK